MPKYLCSVEKPSPEEIEQGLRQKELPLLIEKLYEQAKVDLLKDAIKEMYKVSGDAVRVAVFSNLPAGHEPS